MQMSYVASTFLCLDQNSISFFKRRENTYCRRRYMIAKYTTLSEAQTKCLQNPFCTAISDYNCDGKDDDGNSGGFFTCSGNIEPSTIESCTWIKEEKGIIQYFTLYHKYM